MINLKELVEKKEKEKSPKNEKKEKEKLPKKCKGIVKFVVLDVYQVFSVPYN